MSLDFHSIKEDLICTCDRDGEIRYWSINNDSCTRVFKQRGTTQMRFQPRLRRYLAAASDNLVSILDVETQACQHSLQGCDASVLLASVDGIRSEKGMPPNDTLHGYNGSEMIKLKIKEVCPATVSCADILVLAAREGISMAGGPYYPLYTGRRDCFMSFSEVALYEFPSPHDDLYKTLTSFASGGFDERETVSILGAHSIGIIHCQFFHNRLYNFAGSGGPDPSLEPGFLNQMRSRCNDSGDLPEEPGMNMDYEGATGSGFGTHYKSLVEGKGILYADQQLMVSDATASWVQTYSLDGPMFQRDFAQVMVKLSSPYKSTGSDHTQLLYGFL